MSGGTAVYIIGQVQREREREIEREIERKRERGGEGGREGVMEGVSECASEGGREGERGKEGSGIRVWGSRYAAYVPGIRKSAFAAANRLCPWVVGLF